MSISEATVITLSSPSQQQAGARSQEHWPAGRFVLEVVGVLTLLFFLGSCSENETQPQATGNNGSQTTVTVGRAIGGDAINSATDGFVFSDECPSAIPTSGDAAPAIEQCIDAVTSDGTGGEIKFADDTYTLSSPINIDTTNRLKVKLEGTGNGGDTTRFEVTGSHGVLVDTGDLNTFCAMFENLRFDLKTPSAKAIEVNRTNRCYFEDIIVYGPPGPDDTTGIEVDSEQRTYGGSSDASYGYMRNVNVLYVARGIHLPDRGGTAIFGGHIVLETRRDIGVLIGDLNPGGGYQYRIVGLRIDGNTNSRTPIGEGIRTYANSLRVEGVQMESPGIGYHIMNGSDNEIDGQVNNNYNTLRCYVIEAEASRTVIADTFLCTRPDVADSQVNHSTSTIRSVTQRVPAS